MSDSASENIKKAITKLDSSMSKMVEQEPENLHALYGTIRLQIENIEAKLVPLIEKERDNADDDHFFWGSIEEAESYHEDHGPQLTAEQMRKYLRMRLDAVYDALYEEKIYKVTRDYDHDDLDVVRPEQGDQGDQEED